jgi:hypothetical protein
MKRRDFLMGLLPAIFMFQLLPWQWKKRAELRPPTNLKIREVTSTTIVVDGEL